MERPTWFVSLLLIFGPLFNLGVIARSGVWVKSWQICDSNADYDVKTNATLTTVNNKQYLDGILILKKPLDNTCQVNVSVEMLTGSHYMHLFSLNERKACDALHKYLGEFVYELERMGQILPGICPIVEGRYYAHNVPLNFEKATVLATVPFGDMRVTAVLFKRNRIYICGIAEVENRAYA